MTIVDIVDLLYPGEIEKGNIVFCQHSQEEPILIQYWNVDGIAQPTEESILALENNPDIQHKHQIQLNIQFNKSILDQLDTIDLKSIRALRAGEQTYIQQYEQEAQQLRAQLLPTS